jgi:hypothetical protein
MPFDVGRWWDTDLDALIQPPLPLTVMAAVLVIAVTLGLLLVVVMADRLFRGRETARSVALWSIFSVGGLALLALWFAPPVEFLAPMTWRHLGQLAMYLFLIGSATVFFAGVLS